MTRIGWAGRGLLAGLFLLAACAPDVQLAEPTKSAPDGFRNGASNSDVIPSPMSEWWRSFGSDELNRLVERGLQNNHDLGAAMARLAQAEATAGIAEATEAPTLDLVGKAGVEGPGGGVGSVRSRSAWDTQRNYQIGLRASYDVDLWGKNRNITQAALARARASVFDREAIALVLTGDITKAYLDFQIINERIAIAERNLSNARQALRSVERRMERGDATAVEVTQQRTSVASSEAVIPVLKLDREKAISRLAILVGTTPTEMKLDTMAVETIKVPEVRAGLPSELLCRRPDIRKAEANLAAAKLDVASARAKMMPSLSLTGEAGYGSQALSALVNPASIFYSLAANMVQSLFDAGRNEAEIRRNAARYRELLETYAQALLNSFKDVDDALAEIRYIGEQQVLLTEAASQAQRAYQLSSRSYTIGAVDYLTLLDTERTLFRNEDSREVSRLTRLKSIVSLYLALGGGMLEDAPC